MYRLQSMCFAATVATAALLGAPVQAQETGAVRGTVTLVENGGPVHGAVILVIGSGALGLTDEQGAFEIPGVPAGSYEVLAQREHLTAVRQAITVSPGETALVDFALGLSPVHEDVTVTASATGTETTFEAFNAVTTLDSFDLARASSGSLGEALQNEPGIASRSFGPGSSRPVIRGFDGDRVLILEDGVRTGDLSSQSGDHGVTIDPNSAERIEIVRGPATLLYGSNAVGGLVNVITPHESYRESLFEGTRAQFGTDGGSANRQAGTNGSLQRSQGNVLVWAGGSLRRSGDYDTPEGTIENSATELTNAQAGLGWFGDRFFASGGLTFEDGRYGVPFADEFHGHPEEEADHAEEAEDGTEEEHAEEIEVDLCAGKRPLNASRRPQRVRGSVEKLPICIGGDLTSSRVRPAISAARPSGMRSSSTSSPYKPQQPVLDRLDEVVLREARWLARSAPVRSELALAKRLPFFEPAHPAAERGHRSVVFVHLVPVIVPVGGQLLHALLQVFTATTRGHAFAARNQQDWGTSTDKRANGSVER